MADDSEQLAVLPEEPVEAPQPKAKSSGFGKLINMAGTFLTVAILTVLIWVWADQSQLDEQQTQVPITLATEAESNLILMDVDTGTGHPAVEAAEGGRRIRPKVKLKGTRSRLRELRSDLQSGKLELRIYLSESAYGAGPYQDVFILDLLNADETLRDRGITAVESSPEKITVDLDKWVPERVRLTLRDTDESRTFHATIEPDEITVAVPSRYASSGQPRPMEVDLDPLPDEITPGLKVEGTIRPNVADYGIKLEKTKVSVTLQPIEQQTETISGLEIRALLPPDMIGAYTLKWENPASKFIDIKIAGPPGEVDKVRISPDKHIRAFIELSSQHAEPTATYPQVTVDISFVGVRDVKLAEPRKSVKVRLERKLE